MEHQQNLKRKHGIDILPNGKNKNHVISDASVLTQDLTIESVNEMEYEVVEVNPKTYREVMQRSNRQETTFTCTYCQFEFPSNNQLVQHKLNFHANIRKNLAFEHNYSLLSLTPKANQPQVSHLKLKDSSVECKECNIFFESFYRLTRHTQRAHANELGHRCPGCSKLFLTFIELEDHGIHYTKPECRAHQKKEFCGTCRVSFMNNRQFFEHFAIKHDRNKPVICSICEKKFNTRPEVKVHSLNVHKMNCSHDCLKCAFTFPMRTALLLHDAIIHKEDGPKTVVSTNGSMYLEQEIKIEPTEIYSEEMPFPKKIKLEINDNEIKQEVVNYPYQEIGIEEHFDPDDLMSIIVDESEPMPDYESNELFSLIVKEEPIITPQQVSNGVAMEDFEMELEKTSKTFKIWNKPQSIPQKNSIPVIDQRPQWCNSCMKFFPNLAEHTKSVHVQTIKYKCPYCLNMFNDRNILITHIAQSQNCRKAELIQKKGLIVVHFKEKSLLPCQLCPKKFNNVAMFEAHMKFSHSEHKNNLDDKKSKKVKALLNVYK